MEKIPFLYRMIRGAVGRQLVVKHYRGGRVVVTRFPDMSGIVASARQRVRRDLFREAVAFAKWVIGEEERKLAFKNMLPRKKRRKVYQAALQMYMKMRGSRQWVSKVVAELAMGNRQWARVNGEGLMVNEVYKELGPWRAVWEKEKGMVGVEEGCVRRTWRARGHPAAHAPGRPHADTGTSSQNISSYI